MKRVMVVIVAVIFMGVVLIVATSSNNETRTSSSIDNITLQDAHGLSVDRNDSSKVYIATHAGLLAMSKDKDLRRVSDAKDDYMGFAAHPTDPNIFYSSGHPSTGGNIGFQKSTDGGKTWQKVSNGVGGPVDFHAMTASQADPSILYGVYRGQLQRSNNEGKDWQLVRSSLTTPLVLATNTTSKDMVYAGSAGGLYVSQDQGAAWSKLDLNGAVVALAVNPKDDRQIVAFSQEQGLVVSKDGGKAWVNLGGYTGSMVMHITFDVQNPRVIYLLNRSLEIYKTTDSGSLWKKVR